MAGRPGLGTVVATQEGPTPLEFHFVISEETARLVIESGTFIQVKQENELVLGVIQSLRRSNRYFSSPDIIHGSSQGISVPQVYPSDRWDYLIAWVKVLGCFREGLQQRSTRPVLPGSTVDFVEDKLLQKFLGLTSSGINLGKLRQSNLEANIDLDRLLQKHLAILSISGGGKSYTTAIMIEELLRRDPKQGRPALVVFDVHGEYHKLNSLQKHREFRHVQIQRVTANEISIAIANLESSDFAKFFPAMSFAQQRELNRILSKFRMSQTPVSVENIIDEIYGTDMNSMVKDALLGWLYLLKNTRLFGNVEYPLLEQSIEAGMIYIFDLSAITSLWLKQIIVHYFLSRIFGLRRLRKIPPTVTILEEAHQFAPEIESASSKSIIHTIAREGRKFLCSLVLISQRPVNLSTTALSQCNSHLILRILNPHDLAYIGKTSEGINQETLGMLTSLGVGEALLVGEAVNYPVFIQIRTKIVSTDFDGASLTKESRRFEKVSAMAKNIE